MYKKYYIYIKQIPQLVKYKQYSGLLPSRIIIVVPLERNRSKEISMRRDDIKDLSVKHYFFN